MFHTTIHNTVYKFFILAAALALGLGVNYIYAAWTGPTEAPPGGNTPTPVNLGIVNQIKDAGLGLNALSVFGNSYFQETAGFRTVEVSAGGEQDLTVDVEGAVGALFYCDADGNNCFTASSVGGSVGSDRAWQTVNRSFGVVYQNDTNNDIQVGVTLSSPGQGDNFCRFVLEAGSSSGSLISIDAVDGRVGGRWKNELWAVNAPIPQGSFYQLRAVEAHEDCGDAWIQTWAELR